MYENHYSLVTVLLNLIHPSKITDYCSFKSFLHYSMVKSEDLAGREGKGDALWWSGCRQAEPAARSGLSQLGMTIRVRVSGHPWILHLTGAVWVHFFTRGLNLNPTHAESSLGAGFISHP
jgi:hypothetical protein